MKIIENKDINLSSLSQSDYKLALNSAKKYLTKINMLSIDGMEAHDFAVEALIQSQRWGGKKFIARRTKLIIIEKIRSTIGSRKKNKNPKQINLEKWDMPLYLNCDEKDIDELINSMEIPEEIKTMINLRIKKGLNLRQIGKFMDMPNSTVSHQFKLWGVNIKNIIEERNKKDRITFRSIPKETTTPLSKSCLRTGNYFKKKNI